MQVTPPRYNVYETVHKGLRAFMAQALVDTGRCNWDQPDEAPAVLAQLRALLELCATHLHHEDEFLHPALEARRPGATRPLRDDHRAHVRAIDELLQLADEAALAAPARRAPLGVALYRRLALFVAENLEHMEAEECAHNAVLWAEYSDDEIRAIERSLVAAVPPAQSAFALRWMLPHCSHRERIEKLAGMRAGAPAAVFRGVMAMLQPLLAPRDWQRLVDELGAPVGHDPEPPADRAATAADAAGR